MPDGPANQCQRSCSISRPPWRGTPRLHDPWALSAQQHLGPRFHPAHARKRPAAPAQRPGHARHSAPPEAKTPPAEVGRSALGKKRRTKPSYITPSRSRPKDALEGPESSTSICPAPPGLEPRREPVHRGARLAGRSVEMSTQRHQDPLGPVLRQAEDRIEGGDLLGADRRAAASSRSARHPRRHLGPRRACPRGRRLRQRIGLASSASRRGHGARPPNRFKQRPNRRGRQILPGQRGLPARAWSTAPPPRDQDADVARGALSRAGATDSPRSAKTGRRPCRIPAVRRARKPT